MKIVDKDQLSLLRRLVDDHVMAFMFNVMGIPLDKKALKRLKRKGLLNDKTLNLLFNTYAFGMFAGESWEATEFMNTLDLNDFLVMAKKANLRFSKSEKLALEHVKESAYTHIKGLADTIKTSTGAIVVAGNKVAQQEAALKVGQVLEQGIMKREQAKQVAINLQTATKNYAKDFLKVAATELNNANQEGRLQSILSRANGRDPDLYKRPRPDACTDCKLHYLKEDGVTPRVFKASELSGTNIGKPRSEWKPRAMSLHPSCFCELHELPEGFGFDADGRMVYKGIGKSTIFDLIKSKAA